MRREHDNSSDGKLIEVDRTCAKRNRYGQRCGHPAGHWYLHGNGTIALWHTFDQSDIIARRHHELELASITSRSIAFG